MMKAAYVAVVVLLLAPSIAIALFTLTVLARDPAFARERSSPEPLHRYTIRVAGFEIPFHPSIWASVLVLAGTIIWIVGVAVLFFLRR